MRDRLTTCAAVRGRKTLDVDRWHAKVVYALRGEVATTVDKTAWVLSQDQGPLVVANAGERVEVTPAPGSLATVIGVDTRALRRLLNDRAVTFSCGPQLRHQASYSELLSHTEELLRADVDQGDYARIHRQGAELAFVRCLLDGFGGARPDGVSRAEAFAAYVDAHFDEGLTLSEAARHFHLSSEYFSKAFKSEVGQTFHSYLTGVRLDAATEHLLAGDDTVARVALEAGFPNVASFGQAFKARYGITPTAYRGAHREDAKPTLPAGAVKALRESPRTKAHADGSETLLVRIDIRDEARSLRSPWRDAIGLGNLTSLSDARVRDQVVWLQKRLGFSRVRIGIDFGEYSKRNASYELESCFDFLLDAGIAPHVLLERTRDTQERSYLDALRSALRNLSNRYSSRTVSDWRFELRVHSWEEAQSHTAYLTLFSQVDDVLRAYGISEALIGPGLFLDQDVDNLRRFLQNARERGIALPVVSIGSRPAAPATVGGSTMLVRTADPNYLRNQVLLAHEVMDEEGFGSSRLMVGGWRDSLESHNIMNDSCYEGARIMQTALSVWDQVESLCYNDALDLLEEGSTRRAFLSGAPGILSRDGIPKPAYHAFDFLSRLGTRLVHADESVLATTNDMGNYQIVCHNCKRLNATYLATPESQLDYRVMGSYFEELGSRKVRVRLEGVRSGTYLIKKRFVNEACGSLGNEAERMRLWCMDAPGRSELEHLRAAAHPAMSLERHVVTDGVLDFSHTLQSNEIAYFHVIYLY